MSENEGTGQSSTPESTPPAAQAGPKKDVAAEIRKMPPAEKLLGAAAVIVLLSFIFLEGSWGALFKYGWFTTCAFLGSVGVIALIAAELFGVKLMDAKARIYLLIALAMLPALGFVVDLLQTSVLRALMLAGGIAMGVAGARITTREKILR